jgi:hypothetical protein
VLLYGASGDGKSSLINAGLLPAAGRRHLHAERVRVQPRRGEEIVLERVATTEDDGGDHLVSLLAPEGDDSPRSVMSLQTFEDSVREACRSHRPLLIFDQFEEIVTLFEEKGTAAAQRSIAEMLVRLLREQMPVKLVFVFREDYLGKIKHLLASVPELVDQALLLQPLPVDMLPTIIHGPFERHPGRFAPELDAELAERVCAAFAHRFGSADLNLSEVETVALRLWQSEDPQTLLETRGVQGLLEDYLGESLEAFSPDLRAAAIALLAQMVTTAGTRNVISAEDLRERVREDEDQIPPEMFDEALKRLESESRLIRRERRRDIYLYEITSEFLVPWISQRREEARLVDERRRGELRREELRREQARARRLLVLASLAGALFVVAAVVAIIAVWALNQRTDAQLHRAAAERNASAARRQRTAAERSAFEAQRQRASARHEASQARRQRAAAERSASEARRQRAAAQRNAFEARRQRAAAKRSASEARRQRVATERNAFEAQRQRAIAKRAAALVDELTRFDPRLTFDASYVPSTKRFAVNIRVSAQRGVRVRVGCTGCPPWTTVSPAARVLIVVPTLDVRRGAHVRVLFTDRNIGRTYVLTATSRRSYTFTNCRPRGSRVALSKAPTRCPATVY